eukprot:g1810.t1
MMGCKFCATGTMNLKGNLRSSEILEQVAFARAIFEMRNEDKRLRNVVFMGMGEPLQNYDNVKSAVECLTDRNLFGFGRQHVTVSTVGVVESMRRLTQDLPGISLALSLHAPSQAKREKIVPTATAWHIEKIMDAFDAHIAASNVYTKTSKAMMVEYVLLKGVNDTVSDAEELAILLRKRPVIINIIPYNPNITAKLFGFEAPTTASAREFGKILIDRGLKVRLRVEHGQDIAAACGQLALVATRKKKKLPLPGSAPVRDIEDIRLVPENSVRRTVKHSAHRAAKYRKDTVDDRRELVLHFLVGVSFCVSLCAFVAHIFLDVLKVLGFFVGVVGLWCVIFRAKSGDDDVGAAISSKKYNSLKEIEVVFTLSHTITWKKDVAFVRPSRDRYHFNFGPSGVITGNFKDEGRPFRSAHDFPPFQWGWDQSHVSTTASRRISQYHSLDSFVSSCDGDWMFGPLLPGRYRITLSMGGPPQHPKPYIDQTRTPCSLWIQNQRIWRGIGESMAFYLLDVTGISIERSDRFLRLRVLCEKCSRRRDATRRQGWRCAKSVKREMRRGLRLIFLDLEPLDWSTVEIGVGSRKDQKLTSEERIDLSTHGLQPYDGTPAYRDTHFPAAAFVLFGTPGPGMSSSALERTMFNWAIETSSRSEEMTVAIFGGDDRVRQIRKELVTTGILASHRKMLLSDQFERYDAIMGSPPTYRGLFAATFRDSDPSVVTSLEGRIIGYANFDVLFDGIQETVKAVRQYAREHGYRRIFITGRRTNVHFDDDDGGSAKSRAMFSFERSAAVMRSFFRDVNERCREQRSSEEAQDYFFVSSQLWNWTADVPPFVLGGVAFDNWLVSRAVSDVSVLSVDASETIDCIHQEHARSVASRHERSVHNRRLARDHAIGEKAGAWRYGRTSDLRFQTTWSNEMSVNGARRVIVRKRAFDRFESEGMFSDVDTAIHFSAGFVDGCLRVASAIFVLLIVIFAAMTIVELASSRAKTPSRGTVCSNRKRSA